MADTDISLYNLRYNQITQGIEAFGGGTPQWTPLILAADGRVTSLNSIAGAVSLVAGDNVTITPSGQSITIDSSSPAAGTDTMIQYNNAGSFGGSAKFTWDDTDSLLTITNNDISTVAQLNIIDSRGNEGAQIRMCSLNQGSVVFFDSDQSTQLADLTVNQHPKNVFLNSYDSTTSISLQTNINATTFTWSFNPDGSLLLPNLASEPSSPREGELIYNSATHNMEYWNGTTWISL